MDFFPKKIHFSYKFFHKIDKKTLDHTEKLTKVLIRVKVTKVTSSRWEHLSTLWYI